MKCQRCKDREANVKIMKQVQGKSPQMLMLCDECAREMGISIPGTLKNGLLGAGLPGALDEGFGNMTSPLDILASAFAAPFGLGFEGLSGDAGNNVTCPTCGITQSQFTKSGFLGCPDCYQVFSKWIDPMFQRTQMGSKHLGRTPGNAGGIELHDEDGKGEPEIRQVETEADVLVGLSPEEKEKKQLILEKERALQEAIKKEDYLEAAKLRDEIKAIKGEEGEQ